jgi:hypothetical protein
MSTAASWRYRNGWGRRTKAKLTQTLGVVVRKHVLPDAPQGLEHDGAGERQDRERAHEALDLPPYSFRVRPGLEPSRAHAPEFGEDLRRERRGFLRRRQMASNEAQYMATAAITVARSSPTV